MTVEQYERARQLGDKIIDLKYLITLLTAPKLKSRIIIEATHEYMGHEWVHKPIQKVIYDKDLKDALVKILEEKRDRLTKEFESL